MPCFPLHFLPSLREGGSVHPFWRLRTRVEARMNTILGLNWITITPRAWNEEWGIETHEQIAQTRSEVAHPDRVKENQKWPPRRFLSIWFSDFLRKKKIWPEQFPDLSVRGLTKGKKGLCLSAPQRLISRKNTNYTNHAFLNSLF